MDIFVLALINYFIIGWDVTTNIIWFIAFLLLTIFLSHWFAIIVAYGVVLYLENRQK